MKKAGKLKIFFFIWFLIVLLGMLLFAPEKREINLKEISFRVNESNELHFKNLRSYYYEPEVDGKSKFNLYRFKRYKAENDLSFCIVFNWLMDEAYIIAEWQGELLNMDGFKIYAENINGESHVIEVKSFGNEAHFLLAGEVYLHLSKEFRYFINLSDNERTEIFPIQSRYNIEQTLKDYFKLVGKLH